MIAKGFPALDITLNLKDKEEAKRTGKLEAFVNSNPKLKVILHIVKEVPERAMLEEPGFHIEAFPKGSFLKNRTRYDIYLSEERFRELTNPDDPIIEGGYFVSRCMFDRVDIKYFGL